MGEKSWREQENSTDCVTTNTHTGELTQSNSIISWFNTLPNRILSRLFNNESQ